jgi:pimeloyl-ACP methyl ester carboxylesterase
VDGEKFFEILSFDPRGTGSTRPLVPCFQDDASRMSYALQDAQAGTAIDSGFSLNTKWALAQGFGALCDTSSEIYPDGSNVHQFVSTALVARDMVEIVDAVDEERRYWLSQTKSPQAQVVLEEDSSLPLLNYWGFSYGTMLGNTFASMFPERVGRMILDGVVDAPDYAATGWTTNLNDNDNVWRYFFEWCFEAGPKCALFNNDTKHQNDIAFQLDEFLDRLIDNPYPVEYYGDLQLFTSFSFRAMLHLLSYTPHQTFPTLAAVIASLYEHDGFSPLAVTAEEFALLTRPLQPFPLIPLAEPAAPSYASSLEATMSIMCGDGDPINTQTKSNYWSWANFLHSQSRLVGPIWAQTTMLCRHWSSSLRPAEHNRFTGPWSTRLHQYQGNGTDGWARPLLFIGNTADPVTPLRNAVKMAREHEGARVLEVQTPGHCSGVHVPSVCAWGVARDFFNYGKMVEDGARCKIDSKPWDEI